MKWLHFHHAVKGLYMCDLKCIEINWKRKLVTTELQIKP